MRIILFSTNDFHIRHGLVNVFLKELKGINIETVDSINGLSKKLCQPLNQISVILLCVNSVTELQDLYGLYGLFENIRLILVLPDRDNKTLSMAIKLSPCFISYQDNDYLEIINVMKHIQSQQVIKEAMKWLQ